MEVQLTSQLVEELNALPSEILEFYSDLAVLDEVQRRDGFDFVDRADIWRFFRLRNRENIGEILHRRIEEILNNRTTRNYLVRKIKYYFGIFNLAQGWVDPKSPESRENRPKGFSLSDKGTRLVTEHYKVADLEAVAYSNGKDPGTVDGIEDKEMELLGRILLNGERVLLQVIFNKDGMVLNKKEQYELTKYQAKLGNYLASRLRR